MRETKNSRSSSPYYFLLNHWIFMSPTREADYDIHKPFIFCTSIHIPSMTIPQTIHTPNMAIPQTIYTPIAVIRNFKHSLFDAHILLNNMPH